MIRGMTLLWAALALIIGVGLFLLKYEVASLDDRLAGLNQEIYANQQAIHVLKAEWSYLNDPDRLRDLNERHLGLTAVVPARVATIDVLPLDDGSSPVTDAPQAVADAAPKREAANAIPAAKRPARPAAAVPAAARPVPVSPAVPSVREPPQSPSVVVAVPPPAPRPVLPVLPAVVTSPSARSTSQPVESRPNVTVIKSPALLEAEVASRRTPQ